MKLPHSLSLSTKLPNRSITKISTKQINKNRTINNSTTTASNSMTTVNSSTSTKIRTTATNSNTRSPLQYRSNRKYPYLLLRPNPPPPKSKTQTTKITIRTNLRNPPLPNFLCSNKRWRPSQLLAPLRRRRANSTILMKKNQTSLTTTNLQSNNRHLHPNSPSLHQNKPKLPSTILMKMRTLRTNHPQRPSHSHHGLKLPQSRRRERSNSSTAMTRTIDILIAGKFIVK